MARFARQWLLGFAAALLVTVAAHAQSRYSFDSAQGILPKDVVPFDYRLALDLDPGKVSFGGVAEISVRVRRPVEAIVLNAFELRAGEILLTGEGGPRPLKAVADEAARQWRIGDGRTIGPGDYELRIAYTGSVHSYGDGLYSVSYTAEGRPERMLATQLEPIAARTVFPGFDEPSFRAHFTISVTAPAGYEVVSNMPASRREAQGDSTRWHFATTPPMASYLVTVTVGKFDSLEDSVDGIPLRILTAKGKKEEARYAMAVTKQVMPYYREYFGTPYALPKLDQIAVPGTRMGAMEDWGAISYVESALLYDPARSSIETKQGVYSVIAHEIAHQWFGDLVTAASWDEIWLNEAFATWMAKKTTDRFNPDWQVGLESVLWRQGVMKTDAGPATRAIRSGPVVETAVFDVFDGVTYTKGGAVLDMLEAHLGPEGFRRGLAAYFEGQKYSNATAGDLWHYLGQASGKDAGAIARSWTDQQGFPLLTAVTTCDKGRRRLALAQQRFRLDGAGDEETVWKVPLAVASFPGTPIPLLLGDRRGEFDVGPCSDFPFYVDSSTGFFRVQYEPGTARQLANALRRLPPRVQLALMTDAFALAQAGQVPLARYLDLAGRLRPAGDAGTPVLYRQAVRTFLQLDGALHGTPAQRELRSRARRLLGPMLARLGWRASGNEGTVTTELRGDLIRALGRFGDEPVLRKSSQLFDGERRSGRPIDPTIRPAVMANLARKADAAVFDELVARMKAANRVEDREMYSRALANVEDPALARRLLALAIEDTLPPETASSLPGMLAGAVTHGELAYAFTKEHFEVLARKQTEWGRAYLLPSAAQGFNDATRAEALLADQKALAGAAGERAGRDAAADIELRSRIRARSGESLVAEATRPPSPAAGPR